MDKCMRILVIWVPPSTPQPILFLDSKLFVILLPHVALKGEVMILG